MQHDNTNDNATQLSFPVKPGDWVADTSERVAKVKDVWRDQGNILVNLILFNNDGIKTGRESPILDGPRTFEPACPYADWHRIPKPSFPITLQWVPNGTGKLIAKHYAGDPLPNREWTPPKRKVKPSYRNFDPDIESKARLIAAQEMRDMARQLGVPALIDRAVALENEAAFLKKGS